MRENPPVSMRRYVGAGFILGVLAAGANLFLGLFLGIYVAFDVLGSCILALAAAYVVSVAYAERGEKPTLRSFVAPILATTLSFLVPQVPVIWLFLRYWYRSLLLDLAVIGLMNWAAWMYTFVEDGEARWRRTITRGTRAPENEIRYPTVYLLVGILAGGFFLALLVISNTIGKNETTTWWTSALFGGMALLGLVIIVAYFRERHFVSEEGVSYRPPLGLGPLRFLPWSAVSAVDYSPLAQWFVLKSHDGARARIPFFVTNVDVFASQLLRHIPPTADISPRARKMLRMLTGKEIAEEG